ncbi:MAG TPA: ABC transporter ATP-binding protein [Stellaceae bacterium]|nr:ABC transporter ATP-binding protein [Stellaceae bacterium]
MTSGAAVPKLQVDEVWKHYGDFVALEKTSLTLREGEFLTLLGPSGSGKTTLLMMVAGLTLPDGGTISIDGKLATHAPPFKRDIGMVFQNYALFPHLSVADNIAFPLRMRRERDAVVREKVARVLDLVQLPHVADRMPRQLSGGQQQRIALARCLVYSPSIILMDEPLGALDKKLRDQLQIEIKRLHRQLGTTILYVTHDQQETLTMSDRVCLMNHGKIEQIGTPGDLYFRPNTVFAADFLGESNILPARLTGHAAGNAVLECPTAGGLVLVTGGAGCLGAVRIMVRPENLTLVTQAEPGWNAIACVVKEVIFTGSTTRTIVETRGGAALLVAGLTVESELSAAPGRSLVAQWRPEHTVLLPEEA